MAKYVDGFAIALPRKNVGAYKRLATRCRKIWMKYGALQYFECLGDDLQAPPGCGPGFPKGFGNFFPGVSARAVRRRHPAIYLRRLPGWCFLVLEPQP